jgi:hypothetical protein
VKCFPCLSCCVGPVSLMASYLLHPFLSTASLPIYCIPSYLLHTFLHTASLPIIYCIPSYLQHPCLSSTASLPIDCISSYLLHPFLLYFLLLFWPCDIPEEDDEFRANEDIFIISHLSLVQSLFCSYQVVST